MQNGGTPVIDSGKATVDRRIKLNRINYFLAVAAEGGCNIGEAAVALPAGLMQAETGMNSSAAPCRQDRRAGPMP
jgi:hypothetical protein